MLTPEQKILLECTSSIPFELLTPQEEKTALALLYSQGHLWARDELDRLLQLPDMCEFYDREAKQAKLPFTDEEKRELFTQMMKFSEETCKSCKKETAP